MRRVNGNGINWFLAFFRKQPTQEYHARSTMDPYKHLSQCKKRKGKSGLKGAHIEIDKKFAKHFEIRLPGQTVHFGFVLIRIKD